MMKLPTPLLFFFVITFASCASSSTYQSDFEGSTLDEVIVVSESNSGKSSSPLENQKRKVIYSANISLTVDEPDTTLNQFKRVAQKYKGYVNVLSVNRTVLRVKHDYLNSVISELSLLGKITSKRIEGQDVTDEYYDSKIRLENAEKARARYLELLKKATTVEEILPIERELERLNQTIDQIKGRMNRLDHLEAYSTVTISLNKKTKPGPLGYLFLYSYKSISWLFVRN